MNDGAFYRVQNWYPWLGEFSMPTAFLPLKPEETALLAAGTASGKETRAVVVRLRQAFKHWNFGNQFVFTDSVAPTDTERFRNKNGSVHSAESAWRFLAQSAKIRQAAEAGEVSCIAVRPFCKIDPTREFRLFIHGGRLSAMSQYHLNRHYRRLDGIRKTLWKKAEQWVAQVNSRFPAGEDLVIDVHLTDDQVRVIDLNRWGEPTSPLLLDRWDRNWDECAGLLLMPEPTRISGEVAVSF